MTMGEVITAVKYGRPIKVVVFNNSKLGMIKFEQEVMGYPEWGVDLQPMDFASVAKAMGGRFESEGTWGVGEGGGGDAGPPRSIRPGRGRRPERKAHAAQTDL